MQAGQLLELVLSVVHPDSGISQAVKTTVLSNDSHSFKSVILKYVGNNFIPILPIGSNYFLFKGKDMSNMLDLC